jgi:hypothetical protein
MPAVAAKANVVADPGPESELSYRLAGTAAYMMAAEWLA